jgi:hypothetical protein
MPRRLPWPKIAKILREDYLEGMRCRLCGEEIAKAENPLKTLLNIYRHFKEKHPDELELVKARNM